MRTYESGLDQRVGYEHRDVLDKNVGVSRIDGCYTLESPDYPIKVAKFQ